MKLINNKQLRVKMGLAGQERVKRFFSLDECVKKYSLLYESLVSGKDIKNLNSILFDKYQEHYIQ